VEAVWFAFAVGRNFAILLCLCCLLCRLPFSSSILSSLLSFCPFVSFTLYSAAWRARGLPGARRAGAGWLPRGLRSAAAWRSCPAALYWRTGERAGGGRAGIVRGWAGGRQAAAGDASSSAVRPLRALKRKMRLLKQPSLCIQSRAAWAAGVATTSDVRYTCAYICNVRLFLGAAAWRSQPLLARTTWRATLSPACVRQNIRSARWVWFGGDVLRTCRMLAARPCRPRTPFLQNRAPRAATCMRLPPHLLPFPLLLSACHALQPSCWAAWCVWQRPACLAALPHLHFALHLPCPAMPLPGIWRRTGRYRRWITTGWAPRTSAGQRRGQTAEDGISPLGAYRSCLLPVHLVLYRRYPALWQADMLGMRQRRGSSRLSGRGTGETLLLRWQNRCCLCPMPACHPSSFLLLPSCWAPGRNLGVQAGVRQYGGRVARAWTVDADLSAAPAFFAPLSWRPASAHALPLAAGRVLCARCAFACCGWGVHAAERRFLCLCLPFSHLLLRLRCSFAPLSARYLLWVTVIAEATGARCCFPGSGGARLALSAPWRRRCRRLYPPPPPLPAAFCLLHHSAQAHSCGSSSFNSLPCKGRYLWPFSSITLSTTLVPCFIRVLQERRTLGIAVRSAPAFIVFCGRRLMVWRYWPSSARQGNGRLRYRDLVCIAAALRRNALYTWKRVRGWIAPGTYRW